MELYIVLRNEQYDEETVTIVVHLAYTQQDAETWIQRCDYCCDDNCRMDYNIEQWDLQLTKQMPAVRALAADIILDVMGMDVPAVTLLQQFMELHKAGLAASTAGIECSDAWNAWLRKVERCIKDAQ